MIPLALVVLILAAVSSGAKKPPADLPGDTPPTSPPPAQDQPACQLQHRDGPYQICLWRSPQSGRWHWRAEQVDPFVFDDPNAEYPDQLAGTETYDSSDEALFFAWIRLREIPIGDTVVATDREAAGLRIRPTGEVSVTSVAHYLNAAQPIIVKGDEAGDDAPAIGIEILTWVFGHNWNPFRSRIAGGTFADAAARLAASPKNPPQQARAFMGI